MNFESSILKKETLSKAAAKEKESLITDFSKLMVILELFLFITNKRS